MADGDDIVDLAAFRQRQAAAARRPSRVSIVPTEQGDRILYEPGATDDWEIIYSAAGAERLARKLLELARWIKAKEFRAAGGCTGCWKNPCSCPPPAPVHWPTGCRHGRKLAERQRAYADHTSEGSYQVRGARWANLAEKVGEVTCKTCKARLPQLVIEVGDGR